MKLREMSKNEVEIIRITKEKSKFIYSSILNRFFFFYKEN